MPTPSTTFDDLKTPTQFKADRRLAIEAERRYRQTHDARELDRAVEAWLSILQHHTFPMAAQRFRHAAMNDAGNLFMQRYWATQQGTDLDQALTLWQRILNELPPDSPELATYCNNLGVGLQNRYIRTKQEKDLSTAIRLFQQALRQTAEGTSSFHTYSDNLGTALISRYEHTRQIEDLNAAVQHFTQLIAMIASDSSALPSYLTKLGSTLSERYTRLNDLNDLNIAIQHQQQAVDLMPLDATELPQYLNRLGVSLNRRYERYGALSDVESAIEAFQRAADLTLPASTALPTYLTNLGTGFSHRYSRTGRLEDLTAAVDAFQQAVDRTPADSPYLSRHLANLGNGLAMHHKRTHTPADLDAAIRTYQQSVAKAPPGSDELPGYLTNLGNGLHRRYELTQQMADLTAAIGAYQQAVDLTPANSLKLPKYLTNLGIGLRSHYTATRVPDDLEAAISIAQQAVDMAPVDWPELPAYLTNLGHVLRDRYTLTKEPVDLTTAIGIYRRGCHLGLDLAPEVVLRNIRAWGRWAAQRQVWSEAAEAYAYGLEAIDRLFTLQFGRTGQESVLGLSYEVAANTAYAHARNGDLVAAVEAIEQGRARMLAQTLDQNQRDLEALCSCGYTELYERYLMLLNQHQRLLQTQEQYQHGAMVLQQSTTQLQAIQENYSALQATIDDIQQVPGYTDFLASPTFSQIQAALCEPTTPEQIPQIGIYLLATELGGLALIVHQVGVEAVWLTALTHDEFWSSVRNWSSAYDRGRGESAGELATEWHKQMDATLHRLWEVVMQPLTAALTTLGVTGQSTAPKTLITLIPTGLLALWPLHALWRHDDSATTGRRYLLDDYAIRYVPSATVLHHCQTRATNAGTQRFLAIADPQPVHANVLPSADREVKAISALFDKTTTLQRNQANRDNVRNHLLNADIIHFVCHGSSDWKNPLESGLLLADHKLLTVRELLTLTLPNARLATLSACETGMVGTTLVDEVIMLPSALVQAGYAGVVASLWSVSDMSTALLMVRFYQYWREEGLEPVYALRSAQRWVRDTTNGEKAAYFYQIVENASGQNSATIAAEFYSDILLSAAMRNDGPDAHSFAHPFWWAAFYLTGV